MSTPAIFVLSAFLLGLLFGSFLNVCISRLPSHESIVTPRSRCPNCLKPINWYDNIPILSWIFLRARCRDCRVSIPWRYPAVELSVGLWFALAAIRFVFAMPSLFYAPDTIRMYFEHPMTAWTVIATIPILGFLLIGLIVMDWQTHLLPNAFTLTGIAIGLFLVCTQAIFLARIKAMSSWTPRDDSA